MALPPPFLTIVSGQTWSPVCTLTDASGGLINLTGCAATFTVLDPYNPGLGNVISLSSQAGTITMGGSAGTAALYLSSTQTAALAPGSYRFKFMITDSLGNVIPLAPSGFLTVE